jgi:hypothetical protein
VEFQAVACILMRESEYFRAMLADGFSESSAKKITYHAASQEGKPANLLLAFSKGSDICPCTSAECEDLRLLCRLMQGLKGVPYTRDGDRPLSHSQLVRLVILASKLQVHTCVSECAVELGRVMSVEVALEVLERVPSELDGSAEVCTLRQQARDALIGAIEAKVEGEEVGRVLAMVGSLLEAEAFEEAEVERLRTAIAGYLGPVH